MKCFSVTDSHVVPSIAISDTPYPHVPVGEPGRGRKLVRFPVGQRLAESLATSAPCPERGRASKDLVCPRCGTPGVPEGNHFRHPNSGEMTVYRSAERASVLRTAEKGTLLLVEERDPADRRALVLVDIPAGFRGHTIWSGTRSVTVPCPSRGLRVAHYDLDAHDRCPDCGTVCHTDNGISWLHPNEGVTTRWQSFSEVPGVTVLAEGHRAQGEAGRMGNHAVRLLIMEPGASFRVERHGRLYGDPAERIVFWDGDVLHLGSYDEIWPPTDEGSEGEVI